jgi:hypothetical protein
MSSWGDYQQSSKPHTSQWFTVCYVRRLSLKRDVAAKINYKTNRQVRIDMETRIASVLRNNATRLLVQVQLIPRVQRG